MSKHQLIGLCNALYELLQQRQAPAPAFTFIPTNPATQPHINPATQPYMPYISPTVVPMTPVLGGTIICSNESTQQERFGSM